MPPPYPLGQYSSFSMRPADYNVVATATELTFTAKTNTFITVNHPPPQASPAKSEGFCLSSGDYFTISIPSQGQGDVTLIGHHILNIVARTPCP